jgi:hypothetical protein
VSLSKPLQFLFGGNRRGLGALLRIYLRVTKKVTAESHKEKNEKRGEEGSGDKERNMEN